MLEHVALRRRQPVDFHRHRQLLLNVLLEQNAYAKHPLDLFFFLEDWVRDGGGDEQEVGADLLADVRNLPIQMRFGGAACRPWSVDFNQRVQ